MSNSDSGSRRRSLLKFVCLLLLTTVALLSTGCDVFSTGASEYTVTGKIINVTDRGVDGATLSFQEDGETVQTTTANDSGYYEVSGLSKGTYTVEVTASGYSSTSFTVDVTSNTTIPAEELMGPSDVTGTVTAATTGDPLSGAEVAFTFASGGEADTSRAEADLITTTNAQGSYSIPNAPTGTYICVIRAPGYIPAVVPDIQFEEGENELGSASSSETLEEGQVRIVLEWGESPSDLDSHLTGPDGAGGRFHVYFSNQEPSGAGAVLDRDDVTSYGPETVTINTFRDGTYRYSVFNYSDQSDDGALEMEASPARVTVYDENGQYATYTAPAASAGDGNTWRVLEIDGSSLSFEDNGGDTFGYYQADDSGDMTTFEETGPESVFPKTKDMRPTLQQEQNLLRAFDQPVSPTK